MSGKKRIIGVFVLIVTVLVMTTVGTLGVFAESSAVTKPMETGNAIEVKMYDDYFNPNVITIPNGKTTPLIVKNEGKREHTFTVKNLGIDVKVQPGEEKTINVQPKNPGTYELICRYHFQKGMVGKIVVQ